MCNIIPHFILFPHVYIPTDVVPFNSGTIFPTVAGTAIPPGLNASSETVGERTGMKK